MKRILIAVFCILTTVYIVKFEGYTWNPCSYDKNLGYGTCLAIGCPQDGCKTDPEITTCTDVACVKNILNKRGTEHLEGVYEIDLNPRFIDHSIIRKMEVKKSYDIDVR